MVLPKEIAPLAALVLMMLDPVRTVGTTFEIVKELAVMLAPMFTLPVPADADEISRLPSLVVAPTAPVKMMVPLVPAFKVRA